MDTETHALITAIIALVSAIAAYMARPKIEAKKAEIIAKRKSEKPPEAPPNNNSAT